MTFKAEQNSGKKENPYDKAINEKITNNRITFDAQELYDQGEHLCQQVPHWKTDAENPIYKYIPTSQRPFKATNQEFFDTDTLTSREQKLATLTSRSGKKLRLAGTMSLRNRSVSPQTRIRERNGFVTAQTVPDCLEEKKRVAFDNRCGWDKTRNRRV